MLITLIMVNISHVYKHQIIILYTLSIHSCVSQVYFNRTGNKLTKLNFQPFAKSTTACPYVLIEVPI